MVLFQGVAYEDFSLPEGVILLAVNFTGWFRGRRHQLGLSWNTNSLLSQVADEVEELVILGHTAAGWEVIPAQLAPFAADGVTPTSLDEGAIFSEGTFPLAVMTH